MSQQERHGLAPVAQRTDVKRRQALPRLLGSPGQAGLDSLQVAVGKLARRRPPWLAVGLRSGGGEGGWRRRRRGRAAQGGRQPRIAATWLGDRVDDRANSAEIGRSMAGRPDEGGSTKGAPAQSSRLCCLAALRPQRATRRPQRHSPPTTRHVWQNK